MSRVWSAARAGVSTGWKVGEAGVGSAVDCFSSSRCVYRDLCSQGEGRVSAGGCVSRGVSA